MTQKKTLISLVLLVVIGGLTWFMFATGQALKSYRLVGDLKQVNTELLDPVVTPYLSQNFWQVDLARLHAEIKRLDWVDRVSVKRRWPDQLVIKVTEQTPVVRWGETAFLNQKGQIFYPKDMAGEVPNYAQFVILNGEDVQSKTLLQQFMALQSLLDQERWQIERMEALADGVWKIKLVSGVGLLLDQTNWEAKLRLFLSALPSVSSDLRKFAQTYDLRYSNGFVIEKAQAPEEQKQEIQDTLQTPVKLEGKVN